MTDLLGRPKEWNGHAFGFGDFKFENLLSGLLAKTDVFREASVRMLSLIYREEMETKQRSLAKRCGFFSALIGWWQGAQHHSVSSRQAPRIRSVAAVVLREHKPDAATRKVGLRFWHGEFSRIMIFVNEKSPSHFRYSDKWVHHLRSNTRS